MMYLLLDFWYKRYDTIMCIRYSFLIANQDHNVQSICFIVNKYVILFSKTKYCFIGSHDATPYAATFFSEWKDFFETIFLFILFE